MSVLELELSVSVSGDSKSGFQIFFYDEGVVKKIFGRRAVDFIEGNSLDEICMKLYAIQSSLESRLDEEENEVIEPHIDGAFIFGYSKWEYAPKGLRPIPFLLEDLEKVKNEIDELIICFGG